MYIIGLGLFYFFFLGVYLAAPIVAKLIIMGINMFLSDPIPLIDEVIMILGFGSHLNQLVGIIEFREKHKKFFDLIVIVVAVIIIGLLFYVF